MRFDEEKFCRAALEITTALSTIFGPRHKADHIAVNVNGSSDEWRIDVAGHSIFLDDVDGLLEVYKQTPDLGDRHHPGCMDWTQVAHDECPPTANVTNILRYLVKEIALEALDHHLEVESDRREAAERATEAKNTGGPSAR